MKANKNRAYALWLTALIVIFLLGLALTIYGLIDGARRVRVPSRSVQALGGDCVFYENVG